MHSNYYCNKNTENKNKTRRVNRNIINTEERQSQNLIELMLLISGQNLASRSFLASFCKEFDA